MKKLLFLILVVCFVFSLYGCSALKDGTSSQLEAPQTVTNNETDSAVGIIFLGYYEDYNQYINEIKSSQYLSEYAFLNELSEEEFISTSNGTETFAIIPTSSTASVSVYKLTYDEDLGKSQNGDLLYNSDQAKPIIVKCNSSDIFPDANIIITNTDGTVTEFAPQISMKNGELEIISESKHLIKDLTRY